MTINEYQKKVIADMGISSNNAYEYNELMNGILGLQKTTGKCSAEFQTHLFNGRAFDKTAMAARLGEVASYLALCAHAIDMDLESIMTINAGTVRANSAPAASTGLRQPTTAGTAKKGFR